ncbi:hypothetical protein C1646_747036 [Rhizophagus diaphanus]|nr:hypothetical protein C1646_747036 [Rhizophagus diaphanus] [Rhizophagus sp. MUCL 43196]
MHVPCNKFFSMQISLQFSPSRYHLFNSYSLIKHKHAKICDLFGRTGCGKSSIANMLVQGDIYRNNNKFTIGHGAEGETVRVRSYFTEKYQVFDMVGLGEPSSHQKAVKPRKGRITEEDVKMFKLFKETFKGGEKNFIIIITHNFPLTDEDEDDIIASDKRKRAQSLQRLEDRLSELKYSAVELEVLSSTQIIEKKVSEIVSIIPIAGSLYQLIASGVYYKLGKPKHTKERLIDGIIGVTLDVIIVSF